MEYSDLMRGGTAPIKSKPNNLSAIVSNSARPKTRAVDNDIQDMNIDLRTNKFKNVVEGGINIEADIIKVSPQENVDRILSDQAGTSKRATSRGRVTKDPKRAQNSLLGGLSAYTQNMPNIVLNTNKKTSSKIATNSSSPRARGNVNQINDLRAAYGADIPIGKTRNSKTNNLNDNQQDIDDARPSTRSNSALRKREQEGDGLNSFDISQNVTNSNVNNTIMNNMSSNNNSASVGRSRGSSFTNYRANYATDGNASPNTPNTKKTRKSTGLTGLLKASFNGKQPPASDGPPSHGNHEFQASSSSTNGSPDVAVLADMQRSHSFEFEEVIARNEIENDLVFDDSGVPPYKSITNNFVLKDHRDPALEFYQETLHSSQVKSQLSLKLPSSIDCNIDELSIDSPHAPKYSQEAMISKANEDIFPTMNDDDTTHCIPIIQDTIAISSYSRPPANMSDTFADKSIQLTGNDADAQAMHLEIPKDDGVEEDGGSAQRPQTRKLYLGTTSNNQNSNRTPKSAGARYITVHSPVTVPTSTNADTSQNDNNVNSSDAVNTKSSLKANDNTIANAAIGYTASPKSTRRVQLKKLSSQNDLNPNTSTYWNSPRNSTANSTNVVVSEDAISTSNSSNGKFLSPVYRPPSRQKSAFPTHLADPNNKPVAAAPNGSKINDSIPVSPRRPVPSQTTQASYLNSSSNNYGKDTPDDPDHVEDRYEMIDEEIDDNEDYYITSSQFSNPILPPNPAHSNHVYVNREPIVIIGGSSAIVSASNSVAIVETDGGNHHLYENRPPSRQKVGAQHLFEGNSNLQQPVASNMQPSSLEHSIPSLRRGNSQNRLNTASTTNLSSNSTATPSRGGNNFHYYDPKEDGFLDLDVSSPSLPIPITINNSMFENDFEYGSGNGSSNISTSMNTKRNTHRTIVSSGNSVGDVLPPRKGSKSLVANANAVVIAEPHSHELGHSQIRPKSVTTIPNHPTPPPVNALVGVGSINNNKATRQYGTSVPIPPSNHNTNNLHRVDDSGRSKSANSHVPSRISRYIDPTVNNTNGGGVNNLSVDRVSSSPTILTAVLPPPTVAAAATSGRPNIRPIQGAWSSSTTTTAATINTSMNIHDVDPRAIPRAQVNPTLNFFFFFSVFYLLTIDN